MPALRSTTWGDDGSGPLVVLLHGITSNAGSWWRVGPELARRGARVVAVELPGHGENGSRPSIAADADSLVDAVVDVVGHDVDVLVGHSFGGYLAQVAVLSGAIAAGALVLEDPVSHQPSPQAARDMLAWDRANLPRDVEGTLALNPHWSRLDAAWKIVSLEQVDWEAAAAAFADAAPWDLRQRALDVASRQPTWWVQPGESRFVPAPDLETLQAQVGDDRVVVVPHAGHSIHRDDLEAFLAVLDSALAAAGAGPTP